MFARIAVGRDAIRTDDDCLDAANADQVAGHVVAEHRGRNLVVLQLPDGEPRALQKGAGFVGENIDVVAAIYGRANNAQRRAIAAVASAPALQCVSTVPCFGNKSAPCAPSALHWAMSSS